METKSIAKGTDRPTVMSLGRMLDERVCLKIRINLLEHHERSSEVELSDSMAQLADLERLIVARRKAEGG